MRIFYAAPDYALDRNTVVTNLWRENLYQTLCDMGHELVEFEIDYQPFNFHLDVSLQKDQEFIQENRPRFSEELIRQVRHAHRQKPLDLFFSYFYSAYVEPEAIREIGRLGIPTVNWYCNASYQFHLVEEIAPAYDFCLVPEKYRLEDYRRVGATPIYCQEAANPNTYKPYDLPREYDVAFVGQKYGTRPRFLGQLYDAGIDSRAWGPSWKEPERPTLSWRERRRKVKNWLRRRQAAPELPQSNCGPPLSDEQLIRMYSRSRISLGFTAVAHNPDSSSAPLKQVRLRDFEATMSGAFYMVESFDELADFFEPNQEIVFFQNEEELVDKAKYFLSHPDEREKIRLAGMRRARAEHTWQDRFRNVFDQMGLVKDRRKTAS